MIDISLRNQHYRFLMTSDIESCPVILRAQQSRENIIPTMASARSVRKARVRNSLVALDNSPKSHRKRHWRALNVLFDLSIKHGDLHIEAVVIKESSADSYRVFGIDVLSGQRLESHFSTAEVMTILEGSMLVTSLEKRSVWELLLRKVNLGKVSAFTRCGVLPAVDGILLGRHIQSEAMKKSSFLHVVKYQNRIEAIINQSASASCDPIHSSDCSSVEVLVESEEELEEMTDDLDDTEVSPEELIEGSNAILLPPILGIKSAKSAPKYLGSSSKFTVTSKKLGEIIPPIKRAKDFIIENTETHLQPNSPTTELRLVSSIIGGKRK